MTRFLDDDNNDSNVVNTFEAMVNHGIYDKKPERAPREPRPARPKYEAVLCFADGMLNSDKQIEIATLALVQLLGISAERAFKLTSDYAAQFDSRSYSKFDSELPRIHIAVNVTQVGALHAQFTRNDKWVGKVILEDLRPLSSILDVSSKRGASF